LNNFAAAFFFYRLFPKLKLVLFITAGLVAISRVYLGLHYPSDIIGGALIGILFGYIFSTLVLMIEKKFFPEKEFSSGSTSNNSQDTK
jgi:undecaprenyl-diphosphatase